MVNSDCDTIIVGAGDSAADCAHTDEKCEKSLFHEVPLAALNSQTLNVAGCKGVPCERKIIPF